jgi:hypothetical protein
MEGVAAHLAACPACAELAREVENENATLNLAFAQEMALSVPTARLRERLETAIKAEPLQAQASSVSTPPARVREWLAALVASLTLVPQSAAALATLAAIVVFGSIFVIGLRPSKNQQGEPSTLVAINPASAGVKSMGDAPFPLAGRKIEAAPESVQTVRGAQLTKARGSAAPRAMFREAVYHPDVERRAEPHVQDLLLPGERGYLQAIASLTVAIKASGETALKPTQRVEFERNLAMIDQAIAATRHAAWRNPNDPENAKFLYSAYQSKVELLSTVADQSQQYIAAR